SAAAAAGIRRASRRRGIRRRPTSAFSRPPTAWPTARSPSLTADPPTTGPPMIRLALKARAKAAALDAAWRRKRRRILYRTGGYTLKVGIRHEIPTRKTRAAPGAKPHGHTRALKKNSAFDVDESRGEVAIGFVKFR